jgi:hypothetical protein
VLARLIDSEREKMRERESNAQVKMRRSAAHANKFSLLQALEEVEEVSSLSELCLLAHVSAKAKVGAAVPKDQALALVAIQVVERECELGTGSIPWPPPPLPPEELGKKAKKKKEEVLKAAARAVKGAAVDSAQARVIYGALSAIASEVWRIALDFDADGSAVEKNVEERGAAEVFFANVWGVL